MTHPPISQTAETGISAWIGAQAAFAAALAEYQATAPTCRSYDSTDVLQAIAPTHHLGFCWSLVRDGDGHQVRVLHQSGWDLQSTATTGDEWRTLANLFGVTTAAATESVAAAQPKQPKAKAPQVAAEPDEFEDDLIGPGQSETPAPPGGLTPLTDTDRETCVALIRQMAPADRKKFTEQFREHFSIPATSKTITPHITQVQHQMFIQSFVDELELSGVI